MNIICKIEVLGIFIFWYWGNWLFLLFRILKLFLIMWNKFVIGLGLCVNFFGVDVLVFCCFLMFCFLVKVVVSGIVYEVLI